MSGTIDFRHDAATDIVFVTPHWTLQTHQDVLLWYQQYVDYCESNFPGRRVDMIIELSDFHIGPSIAAEWGVYRARVHQSFTRHSCRVNADLRVRLHVLTSGARHNVAAQTDEVSTLEEAVKVIEAKRQGATSSSG